MRYRDIRKGNAIFLQPNMKNVTINMTKIMIKIKDRKLTQTDVAKITGIRLTAVNTSCKKGIHTTRLAKIYANALKCDPHEIIEL